MNQKLLIASKKGMSSVNSKMQFLIGALIVVVLATSLAPTMFTNVNDLVNGTGVPSWVPTVLFVIVGAGLVFLIWKSFGNN
jgi:protein-S-isoprenylcysteine O-methyltransferase Ste14